MILVDYDVNYGLECPVTFVVSNPLRLPILLIFITSAARNYFALKKVSYVILQNTLKIPSTYILEEVLYA